MKLPICYREVGADMTLRPSLPPDANGSVLKFQVFFIDFTLQHISIFGLQSLDIEPKRELDYLIIVCKHDFTFMAIKRNLICKEE